MIPLLDLKRDSFNLILKTQATAELIDMLYYFTLQVSIYTLVKKQNNSTTTSTYIDFVLELRHASQHHYTSKKTSQGAEVTEIIPLSEGYR